MDYKCACYNRCMAGMEKVVKCSNRQCGLHFGYSEAKTKCPFCHTEYGETVGGKTVEEKPSAQGGSASDGKEKKGTTKTKKESFKMEW